MTSAVAIADMLAFIKRAKAITPGVITVSLMPLQ